MRKFNDFQEIIQNAGLFVLRKYQGFEIPLQELESIGFLTFARLGDSTISGKAFDNLLFKAAVNDMVSFLRKELRQLEKIYHCEITTHGDFGGSAEISLDFLIRVEQLSQEAGELVRAILRNPEGVFGPHKETKYRVKNWCRGKGWSYKKIDIVCSEIKKMLQG